MVKRWVQLRLLALGAIFTLSACRDAPIEGTYHTDDGEGSRATMILEGGSVQFWQGDTDLPPVTGHYTLQGGQVVLSIGAETMTVIFRGDCLLPEDDPSQKICKIS